MEIITSITAYPKQQFVLKLENNEFAIMRLYYYSSQQSWYFDIEYKDYVNNGNKVVITLNALRHLRNKLPFGISFLSGSSAEPFELEDFVNKKVLMVLLNKEDVNELEELVYNVQ